MLWNARQVAETWICQALEEEQKCQKHHVLGMEFDTVVCYAFKVETCPYSIFILLSSECNTNV